ncbi:MAG: DUF6197 family protein [Mycobacterium sp.]
MSDKTPLQILKDGLTYLRENGWVRGEFGYNRPGDKCRSCAMGAIYAGADIGISEDSNQVHDALKLLRDQLPADVGSITRYNDIIAKRRRDVERLFEKAIKKAEAAA